MAGRPCSAECVIAALFGIAVLVLAGTLLPAAVRSLRGDGGDGPRRLLASALRGVPTDRADWARAMLAELDHVPGGRARWRFSIGCAWAALHMRLLSREPGGALLRIVVLGGATLALVLTGYGLVRYPGLRSEPHAWGAMTVFLLTLGCFATIALALSRGSSRQASSSRGYGLLGGMIIGVGWLLVLVPPAGLKAWVLLPLLVALLGPVVVATLAGRREARTGTLAAVWCGITGGLAVFVVWVIATYAQAGGPYDAGLVRDFHASSASDLTAYAVSDDLGSGLVLLLLVPTVTVALGSVAVRVTAATRRV